MTPEQFKKIQKKIPDTPGVYYFLGPKHQVLYIGKATSLRSRLRSYFAGDLIATRGPLLVEMLERAKKIDWKQTDSVLEALILDANLIRTHQPTYNTLQKDDKSFNYVIITKEDFPRVLVVRGKEIETGQLRKAPSLRRDKHEPYSFAQDFAQLTYTFGPFPHGLQLREAMKLVRKIFPYRDTCTPCEALAKQGKSCKACFNLHIGLCPGVCTGEISKEEYRKIIRNIALLFEGKKGSL
jgi:excinuclease ABC subunit C